MLIKKFMKLKTFLLIICLIFSILYTGRMYAMNNLQLLLSNFEYVGYLLNRAGKMNENRGQPGRAAEYYAEASKYYVMAGEINKTTGQIGTAAADFEIAGWSFVRVGKLYRVASPEAAAVRFQQAGSSFARAGELYYQAGQLSPATANVPFYHAGQLKASIRNYTNAFEQYVLANQPGQADACFKCALQISDVLPDRLNRELKLLLVKVQTYDRKIKGQHRDIFRMIQRLPLEQSPPTFNVRSPDNRLEAVVETETRKRSAGDDRVHDQPPPKRWRPWEE